MQTRETTASVIRKAVCADPFISMASKGALLGIIDLVESLQKTQEEKFAELWQKLAEIRRTKQPTDTESGA